MGDVIEKTGILLTSHPRQQLFMRQGILSLVCYPGPVVLGYDDVDVSMLPLNQIMPPVTDFFCTGNPYPPGSGHVRGELLQMKRGGEIVADRDCEYIFKAGADSTCYRWRKAFEALVWMLESERVDIVNCGTALVFGRVAAYNRIMEPYHLHHRKPGSAELFFARRIRDLNIPVKGIRREWWAQALGREHVQGIFTHQTGICVAYTWEIGELWPRTGPAMTHCERMAKIAELREQYAVAKAEQKAKKEEAKRQKREAVSA